MKKILLYTLAAVFTMIFTFSCKDDPAKPSDNTVSFHFATGSYWIYDYYTLDSNSVRDENTKITDSSFIAGKKTLFGKEAIIFITMTEGTPDTTYYAVEGKKLYTTVQDVSPQYMTGLPLPLDMQEDKWYLIADFDSNDWVVYTENLKNDTITLPSGIKVPVTGPFTITGKRIESQVVKWGESDDSTATATDFLLTYSFTGKAFGIMDLSVNIPIHNWFLDRIGFVKRKMESVKITTVLINYNLTGFETFLLRYKNLAN